MAPAADLGGGGKIAGDPIWDVKEIGAAMDQLAREIIRHLKDHKVTVVWLFDESVSMEDDKKTVIDKFDRVSSELKKFIAQEKEKKSAGALNHAIAGFGAGARLHAGEAPRRHRPDRQGDQDTCRSTPPASRTPCGRSARSPSATPALVRKDRKVLIVLVTDESGDDGADVEEARQALKRHKIPLYVIGRQSLFGFPFAHHRYEDPVTHDVYHPLIRRGPETADLELYQWDGLYDRWDEQPSGFAPWELARLTKESGGIYFVLPSEEFMRVRHREQAYSIHRAEGIPARVRQSPGLHREAQRLAAAPDAARDRRAGPRVSLPPRLPDRGPPQLVSAAMRGGPEGHRSSWTPS